jgi:hypothetical protein
MDPHHAEPEKSSAATSVEPSMTTSGSTPLAARQPRVVLARFLTLVAGLLAGVSAWYVGEATLDHFKPSAEAAADLYRFTRLNKEQAIANGRNGAVAFGALGGILGLVLGLAGGLSRRSPTAALIAGLVGLVLGTVAGALPAFGVMPWQWDHRNDDPGTLDLSMPLMTCAALWTGLGATAGLAYGLGRAGFRPGPLFSATLGGVIGAVLGTAFYEVVGALAFPFDHTAYPISLSTVTRLLARVSVAGFATLGTLLLLHSRHALDKKPARAPSPLA